MLMLLSIYSDNVQKVETLFVPVFEREVRGFSIRLRVMKMIVLNYVNDE